MAPVVYAAVPMEAATQSTAMAVEVVGRMMANIAQDAYGAWADLAAAGGAGEALLPVRLAVVSCDGHELADGELVEVVACLSDVGGDAGGLPERHVGGHTVGYGACAR